ncbi:hypothetical protein [uncultured Thiodictyon sp.]|uniref:hypothetical protein n=1 Tax=uncultured Thiodictyon sp. TaxID=1846217 RepID=UPI0025DF5950|nr:hypothetical protein [uncultured Thiodictyon sp.]
MIPPSYSVCRGQADQGIGEAGTPIKRGEQYLAADAPLQSNPELLRGIRQWLTLDASPGDHGRLPQRLIGWSCFPAGPYYFVVRLTAAGKYDRRDAYFAHARAWLLSACTGGFDPGLYLGQDAAFLTQAPTPGATPVSADLPPPTVAPLDPILAGKALAISLIAHLFHGMMTGWPVILGVPLTQFTAESPLARIVAFARGALPQRLRQRCRVRVFSRIPESFLGIGSDPNRTAVGAADLLVIPEELAGPALSTVRRRALLLDARGERHDGPAPADGLFDYAQAVIESAQRFPAHLTGFSERFDRLWTDTGAPPGPDLTGWVTLTYNLAVALAGTAAHCGSLFANFLLVQARTNPLVPWPTLIRAQDWARFPPDHLIRFILRADDGLTVGERRLQDTLVDAFQQRSATLDAGLTAWWNPAEGAKRRRLLELCDLAPPLITARRSAALTGPLSIADLAASGGPLAGALRAEYQAGMLGARQAESAGLLAWLDQSGLFELMLEAGKAGVLAPPWESGDLATLPLPQATALARQLLSHPQSLTALGDLASRLFLRLRAQPGGVEAIAADLQGAIGRLDPATDPLAYLDLATPLAQTRPAQTQMLRQRFWTATAGLAKVLDPAGILAQLVAGRWDFLSSDTLFDGDGYLHLRPTPQVATLLLGQESLCQRLRCRDLIPLAALLPASAESAIAAYQRRLQSLMVQEPEPTTARLIEAGAWLAWRRHADRTLDAPIRRRLAILWMTSPALAALRDDAARVRPPQWRMDRPANRSEAPHEPLVDVTRETWAQVLEDLGTLTPQDLRRLTQPGTHWPWVHPFQTEQTQELAGRGGDPDGMAGLCAAPAHRGAPPAAVAPDWAAAVIAALADGSALSPVLARLCQQVQDGERRADSHPLIALLRAIRDLPACQRSRTSPLIKYGWNTLSQMLTMDRACYDWAGLDDARAILPLLHVAAILQPDRQAGTLAQWLMYHPACATLRRDPRWWEALLDSVLEETAAPGARGGGARLAEATRQAALALIDAEADALPAAESLALTVAWRARAIDRIWTDPCGGCAQ